MALIGLFSDRKTASNKKESILSGVVFALVMVIVGFPMATYSSHEDSHERTKTTQTSSKKTSKSSDDKEKQEIAKKKAANEKHNFAQYKRALANFPAKTQNVVTSAKVDSISGETVVVLSDNSLTLNTNELKNLAKSTWTTVSELRDNYTPFPDSDASAETLITIKDSADNEIAHTSMWGSFKFDADK